MGARASAKMRDREGLRFAGALGAGATMYGPKYVSAAVQDSVSVRVVTCTRTRRFAKTTTCSKPARAGAEKRHCFRPGSSVAVKSRLG